MSKTSGQKFKYLKRTKRERKELLTMKRFETKRILQKGFQLREIVLEPRMGLYENLFLRKRLLKARH